MPLLHILLALIVVGFLLWLVNRFIPMAGSIKSILNGVVVIGVVLWLLNIFGVLHSLSRIRVGGQASGQISQLKFRRKHRPINDVPFITNDGRRSRCNGGNTMKRIGIIQTTALVLLLGIS